MSELQVAADEDTDCPPLPRSEVTRTSVDQLIQHDGQIQLVAQRTGRTASNIRKSLRTKEGREYLRWHVEQGIAEAAPLALATLIKLMSTSRSDKVKYEAAVEVLRQGEYGTERREAAGNGVIVQLNLSSPQKSEGV